MDGWINPSIHKELQLQRKRTGVVSITHALRENKTNFMVVGE
jgi:hypothetical protein